MQLLRRSLRCAELAGDRGAGAAALNNLGLVLTERGEPSVVIDQLQEALRLLVQLGDRHREAAAHSNLADALHAGGRRDEALNHVKRSAALLAAVRSGPLEERSEIWSLTAW